MNKRDQMPIADEKLSDLLQRIGKCEACTDLPLGVRPILQVNKGSRVLIVGQAPGRITHNKGVPFDDPSGDRLRDWMGIDREVFYDSTKIAIVPMGFCFPGTKNSGDLPPRPICAETWRRTVLDHLQQVALIIVIGRYAINWHIPELSTHSVTDAVKQWEVLLPSSIILPHPSPRNNRWLKSNPWFETDVLPNLRERISKLLS